MSESVKIVKNDFSSTPWNPIWAPWESPTLQFWDLRSGLSAAEVSSSSFFFFFLTELECDCLITAFGPRGAVEECGVINPICTLGHTPGI